MRDTLWVCKDGRRLPVTQMETSHVQNAINLIHRKRGWRRGYLKRLELELLIRGLRDYDNALWG